MANKCLDTNTLSEMLKNNKLVIEKVSKDVGEEDSIAITIITYYEVLRGLKYVNAKVKMNRFNEMIEGIDVLGLDMRSCEKAAEIYSSLRKRGQIIEDADILIAGIVTANEYTLITANIRHFGRVEGLVLESWE